MFFVLIGWVLFNRTEFSQIAAALKTMFVFTPTDWVSAVAENSQLLLGLVYLPLGVLACLPWKVQLPQWLRYFLCLALLGICIVLILSSSYNPFIYFRF